MVKQKPVSVKWQVVFSFIPILDFWALHRIEKLRLYLLIVYGSILGSFGIYAIIFTPSKIALIIISIVFQPVVIYLVVNWSRKWNQKINKI